MPKKTPLSSIVLLRKPLASVRSCKQLANRLVTPVALLLAASLAGCGSDMADLDARTDALVRERSALLGPSASPPRIPSGAVTTSNTGASIDKVPPTVNPDVNDLRYLPADEARNVGQRLDAYQNQVGDPVVINLRESFHQAHLSAREFLDAQDQYVLQAIRLLIVRHSFDWRFFANTTVDVTATGNDGAYESPLRVMQDLGVTRRFENGGTLEARMVFDATEQLRNVATDRYTQASSLVLSGTLPLLRGAGTVASEDLIAAERELVYSARSFEDARRLLLVSIASDYFDLVQQQSAIKNQTRQLESLRQLEERTAALVAAGRIAEFERNIARSRVLSATSSLANLRETYILALDRFKIRLGLNINRPLDLAPITLMLPEPEITPDAAAALALDYRLDLQIARDRVDDARRTVANARNDLLPQANLFGSATARTKPASREGGFVYESDDAIYQGGITFGLPLDREAERLRVRAANIALEKSIRDLDQFRDTIVVQARSRVREIDRARFNLTLAEQSVEINTRRVEEQNLKRDEVAAQTIVDSQNDLLQAENARDQAVTDLRNAILNYLIATGQLRVARDGTFLPLPGMEAKITQ